jgi:hypothetical protein
MLENKQEFGVCVIHGCTRENARKQKRCVSFCVCLVVDSCILFCLSCSKLDMNLRLLQSFVATKHMVATSFFCFGF